MQPRNVRIKKLHGAPTVPLFLGGPVISRFGVATVEMEILVLKTCISSSADCTIKQCKHFLSLLSHGS